MRAKIYLNVLLTGWLAVSAQTASAQISREARQEAGDYIYHDDERGEIALKDIPTRAERERDLSMRTRRQEEYNPAKFREGDFIIAPSLGLGGQYNDNIFATDTSQKSDFIYTAAPKINATSDFQQHQVSAEIFAEQGLYQKQDDENYLDYGTRLGGRYDLPWDFSIPVSVGYFHDHIRRSSPEGRSGLEPTEFDLIQARAGINHSGHTLDFSLDGEYNNFDFDDTPATGGIVINNDDRDREELLANLRFGFAPEAIIAPFVYGEAKDISYDDKVDDGGFDRSAVNTGYGAGSVFSISDVFITTVTLGMINRDVNDPRFKDINAPAYSLEFIWDPTALLTIRLGGERILQETSLSGFSASLDNIIELTADYEVLPNLVLSPRLQYQEKEYRGVTRAELERYLGDMRMTYKLSRSIWTSLGYQYTHQDADESPQLTDFERNQVSLTLRLQI